MKTLITLLIVTMLALVGCVTTQKACCPPEDVVFPVMTSMGLMPVGLDKDFFNEEKRGKDWMTSKEYKELMEEEEPAMREELKKQSDEAVKETDAELDKI